MSSIDEKIKRWVQPITVRIQNIEIRDCYRERNSPLQLDSKVVHEAFVTSEKRGRSRNEQQK